MQSISNLINWFILIWVKNNRMYKYHNTFFKTFNDKKGKLYCSNYGISTVQWALSTAMTHLHRRSKVITNSIHFIGQPLSKLCSLHINLAAVFLPSPKQYLSSRLSPGQILSDHLLGWNRFGGRHNIARSMFCGC